MSQAEDNIGSGSDDDNDMMFRTVHDWESPQCVSLTITNALENHTELNLLNGEKNLRDYVDLGALNSLFSHKVDGTSRKHAGKVAIHIEEYKIEVFASGVVHIRNIEDTLN